MHKEYNKIGLHFSKYTIRKNWISNSSIGLWKKKYIFNLKEIFLHLDKIMTIILTIYINNGQIWVVDLKNFSTTQYLYDLLRYWKLSNFHLISGSWIDGRIVNSKNFKSVKNETKKIPSLIILLNFEQSRFFLNEISRFKIPIIALVDTNVKFNIIKKKVTYPIFMRDCELSIIFIFYYIYNYIKNNYINCLNIERIEYYKGFFEKHLENLDKKNIFFTILQNTLKTNKFYKTFFENLNFDEKRLSLDSSYWTKNVFLNNKVSRKKLKNSNLSDIPIARRYRKIMYNNKTRGNEKYNFITLRIWNTFDYYQKKRIFKSTRKQKLKFKEFLD